MMLKCPRVLCGYVWKYNGKSCYYAKCPKCLTSVSIKKNRVKEKVMYK